MSNAPAHDDQEFLALLVHRGFMQRPDAVRVLKVAAEKGFEPALSVTTGWDRKKIAYLRTSRGLQEPEIPGYRMGRKLGEGGTSEVFGARRKADFGKVALKVLKPGLALDPVAVRRFLEEAALLKKLKVQGIVRGHRVFKFMGTYVMEMDWVPGRTLEEYLAEGKTFAEADALDVVVKTARALERLRATGIVHRDLKPGNIMIDVGGVVTLIDLGFSGAGMSGRAEAGTTMGTPAYLAPEQARGEENLDSRADIYSLGATLYHLVIGKLPFQADSDQEMLRAQVLDGLNGAALKGMEVSPSLHYFIEKMMAKEKESRYSTAKDLIDDIETHLKRQAEF
ncbi:MAG: serine/threonine protein kinase [Planctomycetes bacterium]|nr:serine/threonine protein kinase [Planctomycetota bacterium]